MTLEELNCGEFMEDAGSVIWHLQTSPETSVFQRWFHGSQAIRAILTPSLAKKTVGSYGRAELNLSQAPLQQSMDSMAMKWDETPWKKNMRLLKIRLWNAFKVLGSAPILGETFGLEKMKISAKCRQLFFQALKYCLKLADTDKNGTLDFQAIGFGWL